MQQNFLAFITQSKAIEVHIIPASIASLLGLTGKDMENEQQAEIPKGHD